MNSSAPNARTEQQEIDASARWPVLVFFSQAIAWLLIGGALQLTAAIQLHTPAFLGVLSSCEWFTPGRIAAAAQSVLVYGWGFNAGLGFALWLMARLSAAGLRHGGWLVVACKAWNITVGLGLLGILLGGTTSFELLEFPRWVTLMLLVAYALMGVWAITTFSVRNTENVYASQWYVFAAVLFFPWLYAVAQIMLFGTPTHGVVQALVGAWYVNGVHGLWFLPLALAAAYYFVPKLTGKPVRDYHAASWGFWWLIVMTSFAGGSRLIGGPLPSWVATVGIVANFMLVVSAFVILRNLAAAFNFSSVWRESITFRFISLSLLAFAAGVILNVALSIRDVAALLQFTLAAELRDWTTFYAVFSTAMFGAAYFIVPRLVGVAWHSSVLVKAHFYATAVGILLFALVAIYAGLEQGRLLNQSTVPFGEITAALKPWLLFRSVAFMTLLAGHAAFAINFFWTAWGALSRTGTPAAFRNPPAIAGSTVEGHA